MKPQYKTATALATTALVFVLSGCGTVAEQRKEIEELQSKHKPAIDNPMQLATPASRVQIVRGAMMPITHLTAAHKGEWLKQHKVQLDIRTPTPMAAVVQKLTEQGINITSDLPLDAYTYVGKINSTDAETALQIVFGSVGLDYQVNDSRKLIVIKPLSSRTWYLNIGNRKSTYSSDGQTQANNSTGSGSGTGMDTGATTDGNNGSGGQQQNSFGSSNANGSSGNQNNGTSNNPSSSNANGSTTGVASADDFWSSLSSELKNRMTVLVPRAMAAQTQPNMAMPAPMGLPGAAPGMMPPLPPQGMPPPASGANGEELYVKRLVGAYALNPETGAVTVQAPHWMLNEFDAYITRIQEMYNTDITFAGELVLVTNNKSNSEGFDLGAFATWASGRYAAVISNNALGGITMSLPNGGVPSVSANAQLVGGPLVGFKSQSATNALNIFNSYLAEQGKVSVIQRPLITTTSGVPGVFSKKHLDYYNTVSQTAASGGTGSAATATQNQLVAVELGTELKINPRIDTATGLIRAQLTLNQSVQSGVKNIPQTITFGNNTTTVSTAIPLITRQNLSGEILLRDGDLIVVGGQTEENSNIDESGIPGAEGPLGGILGVKKAGRGSQTYYFALRVTVTKRK